MRKYIGIDISKQTFDASFPDGEWEKYANNPGGFRRFYKRLLAVDSLAGVLMEASGPYYLPLAGWLYEQGAPVFVENPLKIRRFSQMQFNRTKTDRKDAQVIREYAAKMGSELRPWRPRTQALKSLSQWHTAAELVGKQYNQARNQLEAMRSSGYIDAGLEKMLECSLEALTGQLEQCHKNIRELAEREYGDTFRRLTSIVGIGAKTAALLIAVSDNFEKFEHHRQLIAYVGLSPRIYQSGSSVNGRGQICKMGHSGVRKLLFMCALSAQKHNPGCRQMAQRLAGRGKHKMVILIAIANKLLKQAFSIVKNKTMYQKDYQPKPCF